MRHIFAYILIALFMSVGSVEAFADKHKGHDRDRHEQRYDRKKGYKKDRDHKYKKDKHHSNYGRPGNSFPAPGNKHRHTPPPPPKHHHHAPPPPPRRHHHAPPPPPRLGHMVRYATRGCHDVGVWQISHDTYIVKYRRGNHYYTQYLYPYADRYGARNVISVNWAPQSPWTLIPPIQLNINL